MSKYSVVKIVREKERVGLIRARLSGARVARGDVLTYLDSHCECTTGGLLCVTDSSSGVTYILSPGWLEPLLDRIARDRTTVVCPVIDVIDDDTLEFHFRDSTGVNVGGFDWNLQVSTKGLWFVWFRLANAKEVRLTCASKYFL